MSTIEQRSALFPSVNHHSFKPGVYNQATRAMTPASLDLALGPPMSSRASGVVKPPSPVIFDPPGGAFFVNRSGRGRHSPSMSSIPPYRRLGMPRTGMPDFMKVDLIESQFSDIKLDKMPDRMKLLDIFMANFASQFHSAKYPKSPPASRSVTMTTPELRRSITDIDDFESRAAITNDGSQNSLNGSETATITKRSQTTIINSRIKVGRGAARSQGGGTKNNNASTNGVRPGSFVRSKTFDASYLTSSVNDNGIQQMTMPPSSSLAAAIVTLTKKDKPMPLTFSGDVRAPTPASPYRDTPELWTPIGSAIAMPQSANAGQPQSNENEKTPQQIVSNSFKWLNENAPAAPQESTNLSNIKRLLQTNKVKMRSPPKPGDKITASRAFVKRAQSPFQFVGVVDDLVNDQPANVINKPLTSRKEIAYRLSNSSSKVATIPNKSFESYRQDSELDLFSRSQSSTREKSTKTVRFRVDEADVRFYTPWTGTPPAFSETPSNADTSPSAQNIDDTQDAEEKSMAIPQDQQDQEHQHFDDNNNP